MMVTSDLSTFTSRLHFQGRLKLTSALRVGAQQSQAVDAPDLPVLRDAAGLPYIPGSSFKGALRSYIESVARALQAQPGVQDRNLACLVVGKDKQRSPDDTTCLVQNEVTALKKTPPELWRQERELQALLPRLPDQVTLQNQVEQRGKDAVLDQTLRDLSCWTCRLFGAPWLASKVLIKDLYLLNPRQFAGTQIRDGVAIDRDAGRAGSGLKYQFEAVPADAGFGLELLVENATEAELGLLWVGLSAFERGEVLLGGAKSRGLGWCALTPDWSASRYVTAANLLDALLGGGPEAVADLSEKPRAWMAAFARAIGTQGGSHA